MLWSVAEGEHTNSILLGGDGRRTVAPVGFSKVEGECKMVPTSRRVKMAPAEEKTSLELKNNNKTERKKGANHL